jgi:hypothetical protein
MPTTLGEPYQKTWEGYPPHMSAEDFGIWQRYKTDALKDINLMYFDVGLGGQTQVPPGTPTEYAIMWLRNTQKRADVVFDAFTEWRIIELRHNATGAALGRLLMYKDLFLLDPPDNRPVKLYLISDRNDQDVKITAESVGVIYKVY